MTIVVGYGPEARGRGGLELARMLAHSAALPLVVACVIPDRWQSVGLGRAVDGDYEVFLRGLASQALDRAQEVLGSTEVDVSYDVVTSRSAPAGLLAAADRHGAKLLVAGSSSAGAWGHVVLGSVTDRLLHSSPVPVGLAPRGLRCGPGQVVTRVTVAVDGTDASRQVVERAAAVAQEVGARLRLVTFAVRGGTMYPPEVGLHAEDKVMQAWREDAHRIVEASLAGLHADLVDRPQLHVAEARSWAEALDEPGWDDGDVLVVGSSASQPLLSRVFLGSTATRIIRHSPVPVVVVP